MDFAIVLSSEVPQAARFGLLIPDYLAKAARLPPEFGARSDSLFVSLQPIR